MAVIRAVHYDRVRNTRNKNHSNETVYCGRRSYKGNSLKITGLIALVTCKQCFQYLDDERKEILRVENVE